MLEPDITRKCVAALMTAGAVAGFSMLGTWWVSKSDPDPFSLRLDSPVPALAPASRLPAADAADPKPNGGGRARSAPPKTTLDEAVAGAAGEPVSDWERRAFELEKDNVRLRGRLDDMLVWVLENVRGTYPLPEEFMAQLRLDATGDHLGVSDDLIALLRLNDDEIERVDDVLIGTREALWDVEADYIQVATPAENQVILNIPPHPVEGEELRLALYHQLERTLGQARFMRLLQVAEAGLDESFEYFGAVDRLLQFEAFNDESTGHPRLFVRDERLLPSRDDPGRLDIIASERVVTTLPGEYMRYWDWLPLAITRFAAQN